MPRTDAKRIAYHNTMKFALRQLAKTPGFTIVALLTLALGIGANTAIFSLVQSVLLRPLAYPEPDQLAVFWEDEINFPQASVAWPDLVDWQKENTAFSALAGYRRDTFTFTGSGEPEMLRGSRVSASLFNVIGLPALRGRYFTAEEDKVGAPGLVVLSHTLWQRRFGERDDVLGRAITLNGESYTVIGVTPPEFTTPSRTDFLTQLARASNNAGWQNRGNHPGLYALGRMKPGISFDAARSDLKRVSAQIEKANPDTSTGVTANGQLLFENAVSGYREGLFLLLGAVGLVLLIACANLANLLLARSTARESEFAVRAALGASRGRLIRQLLAESLLLSIVGGVLGVVFAAWARSGIVALSPSGVARFQNAAIDGRVLAVTAGLSIVTALVFGLWPAWKSASPDLRNALQTGGRSGSGGPKAARAREALIVGEVALTLVLLVGAGLLLQSFARMQQADLGFDPQNLLTARVALPDKNYPEEDQVRAFNDRLLERVRALPGVKSADLATNAPLNTGWQTSFLPEGHEPWPKGQNPLVEMNVVSEGYFKTVGISLLRGRAFGLEDSPKAPPAVIIDQAFAEKYWPNADPIGHKLGLGGGDMDAIIVGIAPTLKVYGYANEPKLPQAYLSARQRRTDDYQLVVSTERNAAGLTAALRKAVTEVDPNQPLWDIRTLEDRINSTFATPRLYTFLLAIFAGLALLLAAVGLYGVLAYQVSRRTREFGIRLALGALHSQMMALVLGRGLKLLGLGLLIGTAGSLALGRVLGTLLYRTSAFDPVVFGGVAALLALVSLVACWLPARRAARVDPIIALRSD